MSVIDDTRDYAYALSPYSFFREPWDYSPFYIAIGICTVFGVFLCVLNIFFCCCSKHRHYWQDSNTGNRWVLPIWSKTPHKQPPLDYTELDSSWLPKTYITEVPPTEVFSYPPPSPKYRSELRGPESVEFRSPESVEFRTIESDI